MAAGEETIDEVRFGFEPVGARGDRSLFVDARAYLTAARTSCIPA